MASEVYTTEVVVLLDGEEVELRPLPIAKLRKFMRMWTEHIESVTKALSAEGKDGEEVSFSNADLTDEQFNVMIKMCALGLDTQLKGDRTEKKFLEYLEEVLDEQTMHHILKKTGNLNLGGDPNQNPAAMIPAQAGTN